MFSRITYLVAFAVIMVVNCDASYRLEYSKPATLDCSSLAGKVSFYERDSSKTKPEDFRLIINPNITAVKTADKTTDKTADKTADKEQQLPRLVNEEKKTLTFSVLTKEDLDKSYMCKNEESVNKTFHLHPQFIPDSKFKSNVSILASSFRLVVSLQVKNVNCTWHVKRADQNNSEHTIVDSDKYKVYAYQTDNTTQVWLNDLHINKPDPEDTGVYVCELKNEHGFALRVVDIKVQSEIMALWPFLIVLAQVLLCSGMFFIWEKRCARQDNSNEYSFEQAYMNKQRQNQMA